MFERVGGWLSSYSFGIIKVFGFWAERTHGVFAVGVPAALIIAMLQFAPTWVSVAFVTLVFVPAMTALIYMMLVALAHSKPRGPRD